MSQELPPFHTWEFYQTCCDVLGAAFMQKIYSRSYTQLRRWARNPEFTADTERNPLDRLALLLRKLSEDGQSDVAEAAVRMLAREIGMDVTSCKPVKPERETLAEELLDVHPAVVEHAKACQEGDAKGAAYWERRAIQEIRQATAKAADGFAVVTVRRVG